MECHENNTLIPCSSSSAVPVVVALAPMVRGSELAFRELIRKHAPSDIHLICYTPMLRPNVVLQAHSMWKDARERGHSITMEELESYHDDVRLVLLDSHANEANLVIQICASSPQMAADTTKAILEMYDGQSTSNKPRIDGIDLNLGCPQICAQDGGFGAFLPQEDAVQCIRAMQQAIVSEESAWKPRLSCKIRLQETIEDTISYALKLQNAGCDMLALHCRDREDRTEGQADMVAGQAVVNALNIPVLINGADIQSSVDIAPILKQTGAYGVMLARNFLIDPFLFKATRGPSGRDNATLSAFRAAEYLDCCQLHPPPSPLFIRRHLRWIFRQELQPPPEIGRYPSTGDFEANWKFRLWTFLSRPYLIDLDQFRQIVALYCRLQECDFPPSIAHHYPPNDGPHQPSFKSIRCGFAVVEDDSNDSDDGAVFVDLFGSSS